MSAPDPAPLAEPYLSTSEAAAYLRIQPDTLNRAASAGLVKSLQRVRKGRRLYRTEWLDAYANGQRPSALGAVG